MKIIEKKKAISLIVLVITIIVLSILAATVIVSISNTDIISEANDITFKADMSNYKEVYEMYVTKKELKDITFDKDILNLKSGDQEFNEIFGEVADKYKENFAIVEGELAYFTEKESEIEILESLNIKTSDAISKSKSYVGCFADTDGDGEVDGVIFADLANNNGSTYYSEVEDKTTLKDYVITKSSYTVENVPGFGTHPVISIKDKDSTKSDRFYVMNLNDTSSGAAWYSNAGGTTVDSFKITDRSIVSSSFGAGKKNTDTMVAAWNAGTYGTQGTNDMWGVIQNTTSKYNWANGWFIPSGGEWSAFMKACGFSSNKYNNITSFGLEDFYWTSNLASSAPCGGLVMTTGGAVEYTFVKWDANGNYSYSSYAYLFKSAAVRLATTF